MKEINEHLESTPPRWDADQGRWIEPEEDFDETLVTDNATRDALRPLINVNGEWI